MEPCRADEFHGTALTSDLCVDVYEEHETCFGCGPSGLEGESCMFGPVGYIQERLWDFSAVLTQLRPGHDGGG